jgi:hypothetical protein
MCRRMGHLDQPRTQRPIAFAGHARALAARPGVVARGDATPRGQAGRRATALHSDPPRGSQECRPLRMDPRQTAQHGDGAQKGPWGVEGLDAVGGRGSAGIVGGAARGGAGTPRAQHVPHLRTAGGNGCIQNIHMGSLHRAPAAMQLAYHPRQGLGEHGDRAAQAPTCPRRPRGGICVRPALQASTMARPETPMRAVATEASVLVARSSPPWTRLTSRRRSCTTCVRYRGRARRSRGPWGGRKLACSSPERLNVAHHRASALSVCRPGTWLTCAALTTNTIKVPSRR